MSLDPTPLLVGEKVRLTVMQEGDVKHAVQWNSDQYMMRYGNSLPFRPLSEQQTKKQLENRTNSDSSYTFVIRTLENVKPIGTITLYRILWSHKTAWIGIAIGDPDAHGKGYGYEAMSLLIDYGFRELNLHRIQLVVYNYNERAIALYEKLGFVYEGRTREDAYRDGQRFDSLLYGLLRREWEAKK